MGIPVGWENLLYFTMQKKTFSIIFISKKRPPPIKNHNFNPPSKLSYANIGLALKHTFNSRICMAHNVRDNMRERAAGFYPLYLRPCARFESLSTKKSRSFL